MNKLLIKIPTKRTNYKDWMPLYLGNITNPNTFILLSLDNGQPQPPEWIVNNERVIIVFGNSKNKVDAINRDIDNYIDLFDVLLVGSDDMWPQVKGFDQIILDDMAKYYPDTDGVLWYDTEDSEKALLERWKRPIKKGTQDFLDKWICMLPVMGKTYYKRWGYVYHSAYRAFACDNEYTDQAKKLKKITYIPKRIIRHEHPAWFGGMKPDKLYARDNAIFMEEVRLYHRRKAHGFPNA